MFQINKIILSSIVALSLVHAQAELKDVAVYAKVVHQEQEKVVIKDGVVIEYDGNLFRAKEATYSKKDNTLILKNSVTFIEKNGKRINANELTLFLDNNHIDFKDFFELGKDNIWLSSVRAQKEANNITLQNALFSSCEVKNPDWLIGFNKAQYDTATKELRLHGAKVYVKNIPVFYFPYLYIPLAKERRSGFLYPTFSLLDKDGYLYRQPYFLNISPSQDFEIIPQIRTKRGYGLLATYRFVHEKDAYGSIRIGYFKDKKSYTKKYNLKYDSHYGAEINYVNHSLIDSLSKNGYENKLYLNGVYFNDGDYFNLQLSPFSHNTLGSYYDSRLNYYIKSDSFYAGLTSHYYQSTQKTSNVDTLQVLPKLQVHLPYHNVIHNNFSYSFDATLSNITRPKGTRAIEADLKVPLEAHFSLLDNYLNLNISEELALKAYHFSNVAGNYSKYATLNANHKIELATDLIKPYAAGIHTAMFGVVYTKSSRVGEKWMEYNKIPSNLKEDFVDSLAYESKISLRTHQYWKSYDKKLNVDYQLETNYYTKENKWKDLDSKLSLTYGNWSFATDMGYSFVYNKINGFDASIGYSNGVVGMHFGYLWSRDFTTLSTITKEASVSSTYKYNKQLSFYASAVYDLRAKRLNRWNIGTNLNRKCWALNLSFGRDVRSVIQNSGSGSILNNYVSFTFTLLPFGISYGK